MIRNRSHLPLAAAAKQTRSMYTMAHSVTKEALEGIEGETNPDGPTAILGDLT